MATLLSLLCALGAFGQDYATDWYTIDGGGVTDSSGGAYELSGTIGQHEAGSLAGGSYALVGGFWKAAATPGDIPAVSTWGMVGMALLILAAGTLVYTRRARYVI